MCFFSIFSKFISNAMELKLTTLKLKLTFSLVSISFTFGWATIFVSELFIIQWRKMQCMRSNTFFDLITGNIVTATHTHGVRCTNTHLHRDVIDFILWMWFLKSLKCSAHGFFGNVYHEYSTFVWLNENVEQNRTTNSRKAS